MINTIKAHIEKNIARIRSIDWKNRRTQKIALSVGGVFLVLIFVVSGGANDTKEASAPLPGVELIDVAAYAQKEVLSQNGTKTRELVVRAETGGKVLRTLPVGTQIGAGDIIAELENSAQRAALLQAEGSLEGALAGEEKTKKGLRSEQLSNREATLENAKSSAVTTLLSSYATVDSAINETADSMFYRVGTAGAPSFIVSTKDSSYKYRLEQARFELDAVLARQTTQSTNVSTASALETELAATEAEVRKARNFADLLLAALTDAISTDTVPESQIASYRTSMTGVRTALTSTLSSLASARTTLTTATINVQEGLAYSQDTDLAQAGAGVKQAQGAYASALSAYQKTIIRASLPGSILSCSAKAGDVISVGADVCRIQATGTGGYTSYALPLSAVKYTPLGAYVLTLGENNTVKLTRVETGLVTANTITVTGLSGNERIIKDIRGLKEDEAVTIIEG